MDLSAVGDLSLDMPVINATKAHQKGYMIGQCEILDAEILSVLTIASSEFSSVQRLGKSFMTELLAGFLTQRSQFDTNIYRAGDLNLPVRMANILGMSPQPDFVEIITWVGHCTNLCHITLH